MTSLEIKKARMIDRHLRRRGIDDPNILGAFRDVPREAFIPEDLADYAYDDSPLPIGNEQTISQPYIVAMTIDALALRGGERVLEIGTGSGYAAALLGRIARDVYTVERIPSLAEEAADRLARLGITNVHVLCADGTVGWAEHAPYDAIAVAAGGPKIPEALVAQLAIGGRLVIPVGPDEDSQKLVRLTRISARETRIEKLLDVRFVPLIGAQGFEDPSPIVRAPTSTPASGVVSLIRESCEEITDIDRVDLGPLLDRIADARVVLLGEASHGTSEFYRMRARITKELIEKRGFSFVAVEADWPDAAHVDDYVLGGRPRSSIDVKPFQRFPQWMWRNREVADFTEWLRAHNTSTAAPKAGFHGLDLYSMFTSIAAVLAYLDDVDPIAAQVARHRYGTLTPWQKDPSAYGAAVLAGHYRSSEDAVVAMLRELLARRLEYARKDGERYFDAAQNARLVANAERYYRAMYYGHVASWNLRDGHMFDTLETLLAYYGPDAKGIVWEHNSHVGDAAATEMNARGQSNVGQQCRDRFGAGAYIVGFGTDHGLVAAAPGWDEPMENIRIRPALAGSYERLFHQSGVRAGLLHLRQPRRRAVRDELLPPLLERAIGVVYHPDTERESHYFYASLPQQFDEYVWFDETSAIEPQADE